MLLVLLLIAYNGIHLAAWHFDFALSPEKLLWKVAAITIMGAVLGPVTFASLPRPRIHYNAKASNISTGSRLLYLAYNTIQDIIYGLPLLFVIFYSLARFTSSLSPLSVCDMFLLVFTPHFLGLIAFHTSKSLIGNDGWGQPPLADGLLAETGIERDLMLRACAFYI